MAANLYRVLPPFNYSTLWFGLAYATLAIVAILSLIPSPDIGGSDKLLHFITYFILSAGFSVLVQQHQSMIAIAFGLVIYGILLEFFQGMTGYRYMDGLDMLANSVGVVVGLLVRFTAFPEWSRMLEVRLFKVRTDS